MAAIPSASESVRDYGLNVTSPATMTPLVIGPCSSGDANVVQLFSSSTALREEHGEGIAVEEGCNILDNGGGPIAVLRSTASIAATAGQVLPTFGSAGSNGAITPTGTTPPVVTVAGSPKGHYLMQVDLTTGGALATAEFRWSIDGGSTWVATSVLSAATVELKTATFDTGLTITMPAGTYNADNLYAWTATPGGGQISLTGSSAVDARLYIEIVESGGIGEAMFRYSCDTYSGDTAAERTYSENLYVPAGGTFAVPGLGVTLAFDDTPTEFVEGDTYVCELEAACSNSTNMGTAFTAITASPVEWDWCVFCTGKGNGNATAHALLGVALQAQLNTLANAGRPARGMIASSHEDTAADVVAAWDDVSAIRLLVAHGQVRRATTKPFSGWAFPVTNAVGVFAARAAKSLPSTDPKRVKSGPLAEVVKIFHDEMLSPSACDDVKVSTLRTYRQRDGFFITQARLKSPDGSDFNLWPRGLVMDIACKTAHAKLEEEIGRGCRTQDRTINNVTYVGTIDDRDATTIEDRVAEALSARLMAPLNAEGFEGHVTDIRFRIIRTNNFLSTGIVIAEVAIKPLGYIDYITTTFGFVVSIPEAA